jgi:hypothetical protein
MRRLLRRARTVTSSRERDRLAARRLERIAAAAQNSAWDGDDLLANLVARHGPPQLAPGLRQGVGHLLSVILWGELAAWKVSEQLSWELDVPEARRAARSQARDEARHFHAMRDYLRLIEWEPERLPPASSAAIEGVLAAETLPKKLAGMQLMVEPVALTFFQLLQEQNVDPVLSGLLRMLERDEARHIALGINHLPRLVERMGPAQRADLWAWQVRMFLREMDGLKELEGDLRALGCEPRAVIRLARSKQLYVMDVVCRQVRYELPLVDLFNRAVEFRQELDYGSHARGGVARAMRRAMNPENVALAV